MFTHIWMALFGAWDWDKVPALLPEMILLPPWFPLNVYDFACWARQTVVALSVVLAFRPVRQLPFSIDELHGSQPWEPPKAKTVVAHAVVALDRVLQAYQRHPIKPLRRYLPAQGRPVDRRPPGVGRRLGRDPAPLGLLADRAAPARLSRRSPAIVNGLAGMESFTIDEGDGLRRVEACQSPVWDTCLALVALHDAGVPDDDEAVQRGARWLVDEQILGRGDWSVRRPGLEPGGWAFEFENANYPDIDDTAEVVMALRPLVAASGDPSRFETAIAKGTAWLEGMQSSDGGWAAFDVDNTRASSVTCRSATSAR